MAPVIERTRDASHGDFATNVALQLAKAARRKPRELAQAIVAALPANDLVSKVEIAGPGFVNFFLSPSAYHAELQRIADAGAAYGRSQVGGGRRVLVEYVSANPTGPLHVGHGRLAAYGATVANLLDATGHAVHREYYINDFGRQMNILAVSVWLRYLERCGERFEFPSNGYRGDYLLPIADQLLEREGRALLRPADDLFRALPPDAPAGDKDVYIDAVIDRAREMLGADAWARVFDLGLTDILADIRDDLAEFGVRYDRWFSERSLSDDGAIDHALDLLRQNKVVYEKDGAEWFRATDFGDEKDRVVVRTNGARTYFASDIAYHLNKRERGFEDLLDILGADHHGYLARVRAGLVAMGQPRRLPRGQARAVRDAVSRRREGADVDAIGRVRDLARAAPRGRERRRALLLRDAQPRPAPRLRPGAGQVALERQPGLLHPVRARARVQRDAAAGREGARLRRRAGTCLACTAGGAARDRAADAR